MIVKQGIRHIFAALIALNVPVASAEITLQPVITGGLVEPTFVTSPPGDERLFVTERAGKVKVFENDGTAIGTFLTVPGIALPSEGGLLGLAFDPNYADNGYFYLNYTATVMGQFSTVIARYSVSADPNFADSTSAKIVLIIQQTATNHNAGWIGFSPLDGYLYIPLGDGGGANDPQNNGQRLDTLLGSILRIDVNVTEPTAYEIPPDNPFVGTAGLDEIWAYGVRNPWRAGFDRLTGDFYFGDVGQNSWEEINKGVRGGNFGWRLREGPDATPTGGVGGDLSPREDPIYAYPNPGGGRSVVGGVVYRGPAVELQGKYLFAEYFTGDIWSMNPDGSDVTSIDEELGYSGATVAFAEDGDGDVYLVDISGRVLRFAGDTEALAATRVPLIPQVLMLAFMISVCSIAARRLG